MSLASGDSGGTQRDLDRRLFDINKLRRLGLLDPAERECRQLLKTSPDHAPTLELLADILVDKDQPAAALELYQRAQRLAPDTPKLEEKFALASLRLAELEKQEADRRLAAENPDKALRFERKPAISCACSMVFPGLGQLYNGDIARGVALIAVFIFSFAVVSTAYWPMMQAAIGGGAAARASLEAHAQNWSIPKLLWVLANALVAVGAWGYSLVEAPLAAKRQVEERKRYLGIE